MPFFRSLRFSALAGLALVLICAVLLAVTIGGPSAFAQQGSWKEAETKFKELLAARNYPAALIEAEKFSAALKAEFGRDHYNAAIGDANVGKVKLFLSQFAEAEPLLVAAVAGYEKRHGSNHLQVASVLADLGSAYVNQTKWADAEKVLKRALTIEESAPQVDNAVVFWILVRLGQSAIGLQNFAEADRQYVRAMSLPEQARGQSPPAVMANSNLLATGLEKTGLGYLKTNKVVEAERAFRSVLALREKTFSPDHPVMAVTNVNLASALMKQSKFDQAEPLLERAMVLRDKNPDKDVLWTFQILTELSTAYVEQKKYAQAEATCLRALAIPEADLGSGASLTSIRSSVVINLMQVGGLLLEQGSYADASRILQRLVPVLEKMDTPAFRTGLMGALTDLSAIHGSLARFQEAEISARRALALEEKHPSEMKDALFKILTLLGNAVRFQGKYAEAQDLYRRASAVMEQRFGPNSGEFALAQANLGINEIEQGRYAEAEQYLQRALNIFETLPEANIPARIRADSFGIYRGLATVYLQQGNFAAARGFFERALAIRVKYLGEDHPDVAESMNTVGMMYLDDDGNAGRANQLLRRSLAIKEKAFGPNHPEIAKSLLALSNAKIDEKEQRGLLQRALKILEQSYGPDHPETARLLSIIGLNNIIDGKSADSIPYFERVLKIREKAFGPDHIEVAAVLDHLSGVEYGLRNTQRALEYSRRSTRILLARAALESSILNEADDGGQRTLVRRANYLNSHLSALRESVRSSKDPSLGLIAEAFVIAQWATQSSAALALQQMSARASAGDSALSKLVREKQDLAVARRSQDKLLLNARSGAGDTASIAELNRKVQEIDGGLASVTARIAKEFPDYSSLTGGAPLQIKDVQALLAADEAMVFFLSKKYETDIFVVTRERSHWSNVGMGEDALAQKIADFRRGLDVGQLQRSLEVSGKPDLFDLDRAHDLYSLVFGRMESVIKSKPNLLIVATGSLTALPFHLLVTEKPAALAGGQLESAAYRDAAWLLKRHAVTVLPSVGSLQALRGLASKNPASKPMIGFGDPVFAPEQPLAPTRVAQNAPPAQQAASKAAAPVQTKPAAAKTKTTAGKTRAYSDYWQGAGVDPQNLTQALPALPDTADELKAIAAKLGVPSSDILLGRAASETAVKRAPLADYRIVYFATHGLVAGDIKGVGEPSLALSLPSKPSDLDDGLLTASEISQLKLNADWVVLSACNTIAGDKPGAEALSGLARSFFYAGARALLVTHWAVNSNAATVLTTSTFDILKAEPAIGRSEALRRAMLAYLNNPSDPLNAYPAMWGAFSVIGEGAAR